MTKLLFWICIVTYFLTVLSQAELLSKRQKTRPIPSCRTFKCPDDPICSHRTVSPVCDVFEGKPCSFNDIMMEDITVTVARSVIVQLAYLRVQNARQTNAVLDFIVTIIREVSSNQ
jgi:hypothetical protein